MTHPFSSTNTGDYALTGDLSANRIDIGDMAGALSLINRFTGHGDQTGRAARAQYMAKWRTPPTSMAATDDAQGRQCGWSVAQHSLLCMKLGEDLPRPVRLGLLMHDAHEFVTGDVASPIKAALGAAWREFEAQHENHVHQALGLTEIMRAHKEIIKSIDLVALRIERHMFFGDQGNRKAWEVIDGNSLVWTRPTQHEIDAFSSIRTQSPTPDHARNLFLVWHKALSAGSTKKANP
jgi:hypothetical protein